MEGRRLLIVMYDRVRKGRDHLLKYGESDAPVSRTDGLRRGCVAYSAAVAAVSGETHQKLGISAPSEWILE